MKNKVKAKFNEKGLTLIEVLVALAIFSIMSLVAYNMFFYNLTIFNRGEAQSQVQFDVRMASDFVTTELRNVESVSFTNTDLPNQIYLDRLRDRYSGVTDFQVSAERIGRDYFILYTITGVNTRTNLEYELESRVLLNNIRSFPDFDGGTGPDINDPKIYYRKQQ